MSHTNTNCTCTTTRRAVIRNMVGLVMVGLIGSSRAEQRPPISQPRNPGPEAFMERAFEMRRLAIEHGDQPYGAVIVKDNRIVGEGVSEVVTLNDPTAHAEMQAIRDTARRLGTRDLSGCVLYGTARACTMCEAASYWARLSRMYYGSSISDAGVPQLR